jgi:hypothetical protein
LPMAGFLVFRVGDGYFTAPVTDLDQGISAVAVTQCDGMWGANLVLRHPEILSDCQMSRPL